MMIVCVVVVVGVAIAITIAIGLLFALYCFVVRRQERAVVERFLLRG
jgi:hypothetical protein